MDSITAWPRSTHSPRRWTTPPRLTSGCSPGTQKLRSCWRETRPARGWRSRPRSVWAAPVSNCPRPSSPFPPYSALPVTGPSIEANAKSCAMFTPRGIREAAAMYLGGADARDPRASPLYADLAGLAPMLLFASRHEILRDDTLRLAQRAAAAGVEVELIVRDRLPHVWPVFVNLLPEARDAFATVAAFARGIRAREENG